MSNVCAPNELWLPGMDLSAEYPVPDDATLTELWDGYQLEAESAYALKSVYGVYVQPNEPVKAVASIDLCEVVRDSSLAMDIAMGLDGERRSVYTTDRWHHADIVGKEYSQSVITSTLQAAMSEGLVAAVPHIEAIATIVRNWRQQGIYCVANTSTLPGCERGTIEHTLGRDMPDCFDALVLPRNHDGNGSLSKVAALSLLASEVGFSLTGTPVVHIDDAPHHMAAFRDTYEDQARLRLFVPLHSDNAAAVADAHCETSFEAFMLADAFFNAEGVTNVR